MQILNSSFPSHHFRIWAIVDVKLGYFRLDFFQDNLQPSRSYSQLFYCSLSGFHDFAKYGHIIRHFDAKASVQSACCLGEVFQCTSCRIAICRNRKGVGSARAYFFCKIQHDRWSYIAIDWKHKPHLVLWRKVISLRVCSHNIDCLILQLLRQDTGNPFRIARSRKIKIIKPSPPCYFRSRPRTFWYSRREILSAEIIRTIATAKTPAQIIHSIR